MRAARVAPVRKAACGQQETFDTGGGIADNLESQLLQFAERSTMTEDTNDISVLVREFWTLMGSNNFASVQAVLGEQFILEWPQSNERIRGAARFAQMNSEYPAQGPWCFAVNKVVANTASEAVSDVTVTDGSMTARAVSFFSVEAGKIARIVEYWPESYAAPANRAHLVERIE